MSLYGGLLSNKAFNSCISASGGDEVGTFYSGSQVWKYHKFTTLGTGSFTIHSGSTDNARVFLVGGGGGGGNTLPDSTGGGEAAGGGGAGGVLHLQYSLVPRTYELFVGDGASSNENGEDTQIYPLYDTNDQIGEWFPTSSVLTAEGGGRGGHFLSPRTPASAIDATGGGSGGGGCMGLRYVGGYLLCDEGGGRVGQGTDAGTPNGLYCAGTSETTATGGGGAGSSSPDTNCFNSAGYLTPGGNGLTFNVDGTSRLYATGGPGYRRGSQELASGDSTTWVNRPYGAGGFASYDGSSIAANTDGRPGIIVIMYPLCQEELDDNCTQYTINGGALGGSVTYVSCASASLETYNLGPTEEGLFCSYNIDSYPSSTGDVVLTQTGSCDSYIPLITGSTCDTGSGEVSTPIYLTEAIIDAPQVNPGYPFPGYVNLLWTSYDGTPQEERFYTGTHYICAIPGTLRVGVSTVGSSWTFNGTDTICAYYCTISGEDSGSLLATGGIIEDYIFDKTENTQTWYKVHTFESNGTFSATSGSSTGSFDVLVVAGGGNGGAYMPNFGPAGKAYAGGGGAGGVIYQTSGSFVSSWGPITIGVGTAGNDSYTAGAFTNNYAIAGGKGGNGDLDNIDGFDGGSGGGGSGWKDSLRNPGEGGSGTSGQGFDGGDGLYTSSFDETLNLGGGGGGASQAGFDGNHPTLSGYGGDGKLVDIDFNSTYYGGGGAAGQPTAQGGAGGGGNSDTPGTPHTGGGGGGAGINYYYGTIGGSGVVKIRYIYEDDVRNNVINSVPVSQSLWSLIDIAYPLSYDGTGSILYDISQYFDNANINNVQGYEYNTAVLDSGSLILRTSSLDTEFTWNSSSSLYPTFQDFTLLVTWFGNNLEYNTSSSYFPIFSDNNSDWGIYGGDSTTWDSGIVINAGGQLIEVGQDTAGESGGGAVGWHISQVSYESSTNTIRYNCDNVSGSVVVSGSALPTDFTPIWNDKFVSGKMGDNSAVQVLAIYTSSLSLEEMTLNHNSLNPRY